MFVSIKKTGAASGVEGDAVSGVRGVATLSSLLCGVIGVLGEFTLSKEKRFLFCFECRVEGTFFCVMRVVRVGFVTRQNLWNRLQHLHELKISEL
jgi:hypothetical protein